jgi:type VI secretion system secreted protein VgrG
MARLFELITPLGKDLLFRTMRGREELGRASEFALSALSPRPDISPSELLAKNVTVKMELRGGQFRFFNGYVTRFAPEGMAGRYFRYHLGMRPWLWFLTRTADCRIFQDKTVPDILKEVFAKHPVAAFDDSALTDLYTRREYCVQYRETDFNFVSRLMEEEGIYYYFEHSDGRHLLKLVDSYSGHKALEPKATIAFSEPTMRGRVDEEFIQTWSFAQSIQPGEVALDDYDFTKPKADLSVKGKLIEPHEHADYEVFDYPGEYDETGPGEHYVRARVDELHAAFDRAEAECNVREIAVGRLFNLANAPRRDQEREYLITGARYELLDNPYETASEQPASYYCSFTALQSRQQFRPERITPEPRVNGPQTAVVVGPANEEIWCDKYGRIKVQFHWDRYGKRDENSSCWIRVAKGWAGAGWGMMFLPRIGQEVVVDFLEGDPDRPIIIGSVYNADEMPPYELPANKTRSTIKSRSSLRGAPSNFNELRFEDKKGDEQVFIHSQRRMDVRVLASYFETNHADRHTVVGWEKGTEHGGDLNVLVNNDHNVHIKGGRYDRIEKVLNLTVVGDVVRDLESNEATLVTGKSELNAREVVIEALTKISLKVGPNFILIDPSGVTIYGVMVKINSGGFGTETGDPSIEDPLDAATSDTGEPGYLERARRGGGGKRGRTRRTLRSQHAKIPPRPGEDARMTAMRNTLQNSAAGRHALEVYERYGVTSSFVTGVGGSFDSTANNMNLDPAWGDFNNAAFVHEMNHAQNDHEHTTGDITNQSRADYVDTMLREEAHGDAAAIQTQEQLADAGQPQTNVFPNTNLYRQGYNRGAQDAQRANPNATPEELDAAGRQAGEQRILDEYRAGRVTPSNVNGTPQPPYNQYYGNAWDAAHPAPAPAGGGGGAGGTP